MKFIETPVFTRAVVELLKDEDYRLLQLALLLRPELGRVIRGSGGLRKMRWSLPGRGKRGGIRVIYYWDRASETVLLALHVPQECPRGPDHPTTSNLISTRSGGIRMKEKDFERLVTSIRQAGRIRRGEIKPSRVTHFAPPDIRAIRRRLGQSQAEFACMIGVSVATLQNWEQGRRRPEGPARALLKVAAVNPEALAAALAS